MLVDAATWGAEGKAKALEAAAVEEERLLASERSSRRVGVAPEARGRGADARGKVPPAPDFLKAREADRCTGSSRVEAEIRAFQTS